MALKDFAWRRLVGFGLGAALMATALWRLLNGESDAPNRLFCAALALELAFVAAVAAGRPGFGLLVAGALAGGVWLAGALKLAYLHTPLLAPDLLYFTGMSTLDVIAHYPAIWRKCALAAIGVPVLGALVWRLESPGAWRRGRTIARALATLAATAGVAWTLGWHGPFGQVLAVAPWKFMSEGERNPTTTFVRSLLHMHVRLPDRLPAGDAAEWRVAAGGTAPPARRPDLVAVLEESTLDPRQWAVCDAPACSSPLFEPDAHTAAHGRLKVHTYGGATWTSEFAFLTGLPHTLFGEAGIYAPYNLAPRMRESLPRQLKALGYRTIAVYSMPRTFVRAGDAYAEYGFDEFIDSRQLGLAWESTDGDLVRAFAPILAREHAQDDRPLFFMILTMRQHGPHDYPLGRLPPPWNRPLPRADERLARNLGNYLYRLQQSADAIADLRRMLFADGRATVLLHFGDHHPAFDGLERNIPSTLPAALRHEAYAITYYRIDAEPLQAKFDLQGPLDIAFLAGVLLDVAGLPKDAYFTANARLRERCAGRFDDCPEHALLGSYLGYVFDTLGVFAD